MIGAITTGNSFKKLIDYLLKPTKQAIIIGGNCHGETAEEITRSFEKVAARRATVKKPVKHFAISFAPEDGAVDDRTKYCIAYETVMAMGYKFNQWLAVEHHRDDPDHYETHDHDHLHIAINMVNCDGQRVSDSFDKRLLEKTLRQLEKKYELRQIKSSYERARRCPQQGRYKKFEAAYYKYIEEGKKLMGDALAKLKPPREPEIQELETYIAAATSDRPTMSLYLARMQKLGYRVEEYEGKASKRTGEVRKRFRYYLKCNGKPIYKINGASRARLIKYGVDYLPERDDPNIVKASANLPVDIPEYRIVTEKMVETGRYGWLNQKKRQRLQQAISANQNTRAPTKRKAEMER